MEEGTELRGGFTVPDGAALVIGAAVASVHVRGAVPAGPLDGAGFVLLCVTLSGVALTAAGPFLYLFRRYVRRPAGYPRPGDRLWLLLGLPWLATVPLRVDSSGLGARSGPGDLYPLALGLGTVAASLTALSVVWTTWVLAPPDRPSPKGPSPWTDRVGLVLAVAWPLQCGFAMVVCNP
jgi:hypothetical protein